MLPRFQTSSSRQQMSRAQSRCSRSSPQPDDMRLKILRFCNSFARSRYIWDLATIQTPVFQLPFSWKFHFFWSSRLTQSGIWPGRGVWLDVQAVTPQLHPSVKQITSVPKPALSEVACPAESLPSASTPAHALDVHHLALTVCWQDNAMIRCCEHVAE